MDGTYIRSANCPLSGEQSTRNSAVHEGNLQVSWMEVDESTTDDNNVDTNRLLSDMPDVAVAKIVDDAEHYFTSAYKTELVPAKYNQITLKELKPATNY